MRATAINDEMKLAATRALAALAKEDVPDAVCKAYGERRIRFGPDYLIPKPFDPRVLIWEAAAVAEAAMATGVARQQVDLELYREQLERRLGKARSVMRMMINEARRRPKRVVFPEGENEQVLRAAQIICRRGVRRAGAAGQRAADPGPRRGSRAASGDGRHRRAGHQTRAGRSIRRNWYAAAAARASP